MRFKYIQCGAYLTLRNRLIYSRICYTNVWSCVLYVWEHNPNYMNGSLTITKWSHSYYNRIAVNLIVKILPQLIITVNAIQQYIHEQTCKIYRIARNQNVTFLLGECMTGAGGEGGPRGILVLVLNFGGSIGSFCTSTIRITLCLAPELKAWPCCDGVYLNNITCHNITCGLANLITVNLSTQITNDVMIK